MQASADYAQQFPRDLFVDVLRHLGPRGMVKLSLVDKFCRDLVYDNENLWRQHCLARWPDCTKASATDAADVVKANQGSWRTLYGDLAAAASFRSAFEAGKEATRSARLLPGDVASRQLLDRCFERFAEATYALGLAAAGHRSVRCSSAYLRHTREDLVWWLDYQPQAVVRFVRCCHDELLDASQRGSSAALHRLWATRFCWRRSALEFVLDACDDGCPHHHHHHHDSSLRKRLQRECAALDATICRLHTQFPAAISLDRYCSSGSSGSGSSTRTPLACSPPFSTSPRSQSIAPELAFDDVEEAWGRQAVAVVQRPGSFHDAAPLEGSRNNGEAVEAAGRAAAAAATPIAGGDCAGWGVVAGGGLLACRRLEPPCHHWWAWLPQEFVQEYAYEGEGGKGLRGVMVPYDRGLYELHV
ncbi:hypothetical protein Agub_g1198 [Astrephomene gubernaculifera]|uniref:F-box domain-containing protein n=1 Tax=Astrephomene gubernaculifera TaxID=47775 RepID=A0AAD3DHP9_9CHLO|nr:hypothetical protein Agub_g1198 [Astrephomene gubernaculifera]